MPDRPTVSLTRAGVRRRAALAALEKDIDDAVWAERRQAVRALLARPLMVGDDPARTLVRRHRDWLQLWFSHHAGWELSADADACRLVKRPARLDDATRPGRDPKTGDPLARRGYVFLCLILGILAREGRQLTLRNIADRLAAARADPHFESHGVPLDLDRREVRRDLVHALRVLLGWGVLARVDGSEDGYIASDTVDVLYQIHRPVLSRLMAARRPPSLIADDDFEGRLRALAPGVGEGGSDDARTRGIRFGLFRRLLDDPVLYLDDLDDDERAYLDKQRPFILREIERATGMTAEIRAEGIAMVDRSAEVSDYSLPEEGTDGHLTLLLATWLAERLRRGETRPVPESEIVAETARLIREHRRHWRKDVTDPGRDRLMTRDVIERLVALGLARPVGTAEASAVQPLPAIARFAVAEEEVAPPDPPMEGDLFGG
jgi:uncharacterized protein (TIGR02678 family)